MSRRSPDLCGGITVLVFPVRGITLREKAKASALRVIMDAYNTSQYLPGALEHHASNEKK